MVENPTLLPPVRILMVMDKAFPPDLRVENEAVSLIHAGFEVAILLIDPDERPARERHKGIWLFRDRVSGTARNWMRGLSGTIGLPGRLLAQRIERIHREWPFDALHLHDLYLFAGGLTAGRRLGVPVVGDLHENWVEALKHYDWSSTYPRKLLLSIPKWERLERRWVNEVDRLVVVVDEAAERNRTLGVPDSRMAIVPNTVRLEEFELDPIDAGIVEQIRSPLTVVYTGGFDRHRGVETLIDAWPTVAGQVEGARLVLVGDGSIRAELENRARPHPGIVFAGWQPQSLIRSYIAGADVCVVPHRKTVHTDATLPHKLFHYMASGKPVVVTDLRPLRRIVESERAGLVVPDADPRAMATAIVRLASDRAEAAAMGSRGADAVRARWHWDATVQPLIDVYRQLGKRA